MPSKTTIDLNCDVGESFGVYSIGLDREILPYITSANIACGFHAGDPLVMERTVKFCIEAGVEIGAHPSVPDLVGFGRRTIAIMPDQLRTDFIYQISALRGFVEAQGRTMQHCKPHGAIYNQAVNDINLAQAIAEGVKAVDPQIILVILAGSRMVKIGGEMGLKVAQEGFADRAYNEDGTLASRQLPGAVIHDPMIVAKRVIKMVSESKIQAITGKDIEIGRIDTICVHGDTPGAVGLAKNVRKELESQDVGIELKPMRQSIQIDDSHDHSKKTFCMSSYFLS